jgi:hypothetical protein
VACATMQRHDGQESRGGTILGGGGCQEAAFLVLESYKEAFLFIMKVISHVMYRIEQYCIGPLPPAPPW